MYPEPPEPRLTMVYPRGRPTTTGQFRFEYDPDLAPHYTGRWIEKRVGYVLRGPEAVGFGLMPGYVAFGLEQP